MTVRNKVIDLFYGNSGSAVVALDTDFPSDFDGQTDKMSWLISTSQNGEVLVTKTLADGVSVTGTNATLTLTATDTKLDPTRYYYHELIFYRATDVKTLVNGLVRIRPSVGSVYAPTP
jgi:hypothetical protein